MLRIERRKSSINKMETKMEKSCKVALGRTGGCARSRILRDRKEDRRGKLKRSACLAAERPDFIINPKAYNFAGAS